MPACAGDQNTQDAWLSTHARAGARAAGGGRDAARRRPRHAPRRWRASAARIERLVVRARRRPWLAYMREVGDADRGRRRELRPRGRPGARARERVVENHHSCCSASREVPLSGPRSSAPRSRPWRAQANRPKEDNDEHRHRHPDRRARRLPRDLTAGAAGPARARAALRRRGADPQRGAGRAQRRARSPRSCDERIKRESIEAGLSGGLHAREHGGQGWSKLEWFLVEEQFGRSTNALVVAHPRRLQRARARDAGADRALPEPALRGELHDAYAVTEAEAGSDPVADRGDGRAQRRRLGDQRREVVRDLRRHRRRLHRDGERVEDGERLPTLFLVDSERGRDRGRSTTRPSPTPTPTGTRRSASPTSRSPRRP